MDYNYKSDSVWEDLRQTFLARLPRALPFVTGNKSSDEVGILMYHRIAPRRSRRQFPTLNVTPDCFREQLEGLLDRGYVAKPLSTLLEWHEKKLAPDSNAFAVTFDDGYANNFIHALPILKSLRVPATIFVSTAYLDSPSPFPFDTWNGATDRNALVEDWRVLTTDECKKLLDSGIVELGAHTHTHQDFRRDPVAFEADLNENISSLRDRFGIQDCTFAFPFGKREKGFSGPQLVEAARRTGVKCGLTTENELTNIRHDPFSWGRWTASEYDSSSTLAAKLDGTYGAIKNWWRAVKDNIALRRCFT